MPRLAPDQVPSYRLHKASGQAVVTLSGRDFLLGPFGSPPSRQQYHELLARWEAAGRRPIHRAQVAVPAGTGQAATVAQLCDRFAVHADTHYRCNGRLSTEAGNLHSILRDLRTVFGRQCVDDVSPTALARMSHGFIVVPLARRPCPL